MMTKIKLFFLFLILATYAGNASGQQMDGKYINPKDPEFRKKYEQANFDGKFAILAETDETNNYFIADFSQLPSKFEKVFFLNLVFKNDKLVNIDSDVTQVKIWFLASKRYQQKEILAIFDRLKEKTTSAGKSFTEPEKEQWLLKNDKYK
jgi:hypothetical protein